MLERTSRTGSTAQPWRSPWWIAVFVLVALVSLAALIPSPYAIERPGPVVNAFGTIETDDGESPVISIEGVPTYEATGELNVLSVTISGTPEQPASWLNLARALLDPTQSTVPLADLFPPGVTAEDRAEVNAVLMESSKVQATAAALHQMGQPLQGELRVAAVSDAGPAAGLLEEDDLILAASGAPVAAVGELRQALAAVGPGESVELRVERDGEVMGVVATPELIGDPKQPALGISVVTELELPFEIDIQLDRIGGPSAGLTFALAVYDLLTPEDLTGGLRISGTGTIDDRGVVGPIGGLTQKLWGASRSGTDLFLLPVSNCADLPDSIPGGMRVAPVATLEEAVKAIEVARSGGTPAGPQRCEAG